jgi:tripartite-type tricarboxylate transporter receptor subunit TctC
MKLALLGLAVAFTLTLASAASAQPGEFDEKGVLQPLADGFPNRAITIVNVDDPGTRDGIYARTMQQALRDISPVNILVEDAPAPSFGNFYRLKELASRPGGVQGYYPMIIAPFGFVTDPLCEPIEEELGLNIKDVSMIILTERWPYLMYQRKNTPWGPTWGGLVKYAKEKPGKVKYISYDVGSGHDILTEWILDKAGIRDKIKKIVGGSHQENASTIGAGMADFTLGSPNIVLPNWQAGRIDVIFTTDSTVPPPWDKDPNVVTMTEAGLPDVAFGTIEGFGVIKDVPRSHIQWLYKLFAKATEKPIYQQRQKTIPGCRINIMGPEEADKLNRTFQDLAEPVIRSIGLHIDQQKKR